MADLDDLLGGPSIATPAGGGGGDPLDMDDLLGSGSPAQTTAAFDDDLLFGTTGGGGGAGSVAAAAGVIDDLGLDLGPPSPSRGKADDRDPPVQRKRSKPISLPVLENVPPSLSSFVSTATFFARFVTMIDAEDKRMRRVLTVTDSTIYIMTEEVTGERSVSVTAVIGLITQTTEVSRFFGKEKETKVLIQLEGEKDIFFALTKDDRNGDTSSMLDIVQVLTSICMAHGHALPVSVLKDNESIAAMVKFSVADDVLRKQLTEALAFRTELINEITRLTKQDSQLEVAITSIKNSSAGQAATELTSDIQKFTEMIAGFKEKNKELEAARTAGTNELAALNAEIKKEDELLAKQVQSTMEAAAQEQLMRQLAEYEIMKAAHKREIDKIGALTSFLERRVSTRGNGQFHGTGALSLRIDELEDDYAFATEKIAERNNEHSQRIKALAEGKKRVAKGKELLGTLKQEVEIIKATPLTAELPSHIGMSDLPPLVPVKSASLPSELEVAARPAAAHQDPVAQAPASAAPVTAPPVASSTKPPAGAAPAINLDDDDDDLDVAPLRPAAAPAPAKAPINLDDDDDI